MQSTTSTRVAFILLLSLHASLNIRGKMMSEFEVSYTDPDGDEHWADIEAKDYNDALMQFKERFEGYPVTNISINNVSNIRKRLHE